MCRTRRESAQGLVGKSARVLSKKYTLCVCHTSLAVPKAMFGIRLELVSIPKVSFWTLVKGLFPKVDFWDRFWDWTQSFARHNSCSELFGPCMQCMRHERPKPSSQRVCLAPRRHSRGLLDTLAEPGSSACRTCVNKLHNDLQYAYAAGSDACCCLQHTRLSSV